MNLQVSQKIPDGFQSSAQNISSSNLALMLTEAQVSQKDMSPAVSHTMPTEAPENSSCYYLLDSLPDI